MVVDYVLIVLAAALVVVGLVGCFLPVIPGPPLSWVGLLLAYFTNFVNFDWSLLLWTGIATLVVVILDYVMPVWVTRKMGGTKRGVWGSAIGLVVGLFVFPPLGIIVGPFVGAFIGELTARDKSNNPLLSATGSFIGFLVGTGLKFAVSGYIAYRFTVEFFFR